MKWYKKSALYEYLEELPKDYWQVESDTKTQGSFDEDDAADIDGGGSFKSSAEDIDGGRSFKSVASGE